MKTYLSHVRRIILEVMLGVVVILVIILFFWVQNITISNRPATNLAPNPIYLNLGPSK